MNGNSNPHPISSMKDRFMILFISAISLYFVFLIAAAIPVGNFDTLVGNFMPTDSFQVYEVRSLSVIELLQYRITKGVFPFLYH